jgi:arylsulfatase A-like enzyme
MAPSVIKPQQRDLPNVIIIVFDAWSAYHISLYGYLRLTTPNLHRLAQKATVYHHHIAGGNYTLPGTTSLLTGMLPWQHRAFGFPITRVQENFRERNMFSLHPEFHRMAYTHNRLADDVLHAMVGDIDERTPISRHLLHNDFWIEKILSHDEDTATVGFLRTLKEQGDNLNYSLFFSKLYQNIVQRQYQTYKKDFPLGLPRFNIDNFFLLEDVIDWMIDTLPSAPQPFLGYYHLLPPHAPYNTRSDFFQIFSKDGYFPVVKPDNFFSQGLPYDDLVREARYYDEFILYVDAEFARLYEHLENSGVLDNSWLILTSDHGELFERGIRGHGTPDLYHPVIKVPLLVFPPGQTTRQDIYEHTSAVDILPTIMKITGKADSMPDWLEGRVLPPFGTQPEREVYAVEGRGTPQNQKMPHGTLSTIRENYKLLTYFGYPELKKNEVAFELFDLDNDPDELEDLSESRPNEANELLKISLEKLAENEKPFS